ncbi:unnamed protein product [Didymodactylos carnosus]|uniref:Reverse transcriptase domain-containing protein n=1 Tax=Didymodactylos carnosus TaxID=1234261 RepID=A0A815CG41_9BILA|nr:unnamed protein product [Didymodactylos carnosus]CAF1283717.1 unnamed protein product [Didymodactylos carnosus]CAF3765054.1 unnamed protein product [Didymodactylos carnosus]CAF4081392.1 unnamed protein product [Didymodactylos carnosus]
MIGPFDTYRIPPIGVAYGKYNRKPRLIVYLSAHYNNPSHPNINSLIDKEEFSVSYVRLDDALQIVNSLEVNTSMVTTDIVDAFKMIPVKPELWRYLGICWNGFYYFYTRLVFGSRSSPKIFDLFSSITCWIAKENYGIRFILHLLDDFIPFHPPDEADPTMVSMKLMFKRLNVPLSPLKTVGPTFVLEYLGIIIDSQLMLVSLPEDKRVRVLETVYTYLNKKRCTKRELLSITGYLGHASRVIPAGRSFVSYLIALSCTVGPLHYSVSLSKACRLDLLMWFYFLRSWNGVSTFYDPKIVNSCEIELLTDAAPSIGFGGYWKDEWFASP